jgi:hypothetical protein
LWSWSVVTKQQMFLLCTTREVEFPHEGTSSSSSSSLFRSLSLTYIHTCAPSLTALQTECFFLLASVNFRSNGKIYKVFVTDSV